jgi:hypothetical protein
MTYRSNQLVLQIYQSQHFQSCSKIKYICIPKYISMLETIEGIYENGR